MKATKEIAKKRIGICEACEHFKPKSRTCGTPIIGDKVGDKKTCGCFMDVKTKISFASCPFSFWDGCQVTEFDYLSMKKLMHEVNHQINGQQKEVLFELTNKYFGTNNKTSNCVPCLKSALAQVEQIIKEYEQD
jgi:hypothetical protein